VVVLHEKNTGYGAAVRSCFDYAKEHGFDVMTILDGGWQHYSYGMDRVFFEQLELPDARYNLDVGSGSGGGMVSGQGGCLRESRRSRFAEKPDAVLVEGNMSRAGRRFVGGGYDFSTATRLRRRITFKCEEV